MTYPKQDAPLPWQMNFQQPATPTMEGIIDLHHNIMFSMIFIVIFVSYILLQAVYLFNSDRVGLLHPISKTRHHLSLEIIWTILPLVILFWIALPSFALLYSIDHCSKIELTIKVIGRQWYWSYEIDAFIPNLKRVIPINYKFFCKKITDLMIKSTTLYDSKNITSETLEQMLIIDSVPAEEVYLEAIAKEVKILIKKSMEDYPNRHDYVVDTSPKNDVVILSNESKGLITLIPLSTLDFPIRIDEFIRAFIQFLNLNEEEVLAFKEPSTTVLKDIDSEKLKTALTQMGGWLGIRFVNDFKEQVDVEQFKKNIIDFVDLFLSLKPASHDVFAKIVEEKYDLHYRTADYLNSTIDKKINRIKAGFSKIIEFSNKQHIKNAKIEKFNQNPGLKHLLVEFDSCMLSDKETYRNLLKYIPRLWWKPLELEKVSTSFCGWWRLLEVDNRLILPIKTKIRILVTSSDVIHSWAVPSLGVKIDACPGRLNCVYIYIKRPGMFHGQCSELCGIKHGFMPIVVQAVTKTRYNEWFVEKCEVVKKWF